MKVYCFYLVKKHISPDKYKAVVSEEIMCIGDNECALYAYTTDKSSELYFLSTRNMNIFFEKIIDMTKHEYKEFSSMHDNQLLEFNVFNSKKLIDGVYRTRSTNVLCTRAEADHILYYKEELVVECVEVFLPDSIIDHLAFHPLNKRIRRILDEFFLYNSIVSKVHPMEDINYDDFIIDDLSLYIKLFSNTFKPR